MWEAREVTESGARGELVSKQHCSLSDPSPTDSATTQPRGFPCPGEYLRLCLLQCNRCTETKKHGPNERTDQNSSKISDEEIENLSDAEFETLVIRMLTEMMEYSCKIKEELKAMKSEIKKKYTGNQK